MRPNLKTLLCLAGLHLSNAAASDVFVFEQPHMGCLFTLNLVAENEKIAEAASHAVSKRIEEIEQVASDYRPESEISLLAKTAGQDREVRVSDELQALLAASECFWDWSGGTFDVTLGPCTRLWRTSRKTLQLPDADTLQAALSTTGFPKLHFSAKSHTVRLEKAGMALDFGGIAKGYALDEAAKLLLTTTPVKNFLLDAGGQVAAIGAPPGKEAWAVGVVKIPEETGDAPDIVLKLRNAHLATSGDLNQKVQIGDTHYAHIVDPRTGLGLTYTVHVSVIAKDGTTADAMTKPLCILDESEARKKLQAVPDIAARVLRRTTDGQLHCWQTGNWQTYVK